MGKTEWIAQHVPVERVPALLENWNKTMEFNWASDRCKNVMNSGSHAGHRGVDQPRHDFDIGSGCTEVVAA